MASKLKKRDIVKKKLLKGNIILKKLAKLMQDVPSLNKHLLVRKNVQWNFVSISTVWITGTFRVTEVVWITNIRHHPKLDVKAVTLSEKDMSHNELKLTTLLYDVNVPPSTMAKVLTTIRDDDVGTFLPKTVFNINEKCRSLIDVANGILPTCSDAEKLSSYYKCKLVCVSCFCTTNLLFDLVVQFCSCFVPQIHLLNL